MRTIYTSNLQKTKCDEDRTQPIISVKYAATKTQQQIYAPKPRYQIREDSAQSAANETRITIDTSITNR